MLGAPVLFIHEPSVFPPPLPSSTEPDGPLDRGLRLWFALACPIVAPPDEDSANPGEPYSDYKEEVSGYLGNFNLLLAFVIKLCSTIYSNF